MLPLLEAEVVQTGWVGPEAFLAGYGAAQAMPGPLFSLAGYLGAAAGIGPGGVAGGVIALLAIFTPGFRLLLGALPSWKGLMARPLRNRMISRQRLGLPLVDGKGIALSIPSQAQKSRIIYAHIFIAS